MKLKGSQFFGFDNVHPSMKTHTQADTIGMWPIGEVAAAADPNVPAEKLWQHEGKYMENLTSQIKTEGFKEPLVMKTRSDESQVLWEGNHRLAAAQKLGHTHVPVRPYQEGD